MIAIVAAMLYLDYFIAQGKLKLAGLPLALLVGVLVVPAFFEVRRLALATGAGLLDFTGLVGTTALALYPFWWRFVGGGSAAGAAFAFVGLAVMAMFAEQIIRFRADGAAGRLTATSLALLYLGVGGAVILAIRMEMGLDKLLLFLAAVKFTDIGAYFIGSAIGRHKLVGWLSPGKSWEGLIGGIVAGARSRRTRVAADAGYDLPAGGYLRRGRRSSWAVRRPLRKPP